ncbi:MAG: tetratricopeptide repeat protein [Deltaproteobacteria bacterium]|nr:tetratricopeptide repeat protein [Deltaproteobacteria bacterium]
MLDRASVERALAALETGRVSGLAAMDELDALELLLAHRPRWLSPGLAARIARVVALDPPSIEPPAAGESLLLVREDTSGRGRALRFAMTTSADATKAFGERALMQIRQAQRAVLDLVYQRGRAWPEGIERPALPAVFGLSSSERIDEESLGLSIAIAELSRATRTPARPTVAATARVSRDGTLGSVAFVAEKIAALREEWPLIDTLIVAEDAAAITDLPAGFTVVRARTLAEAIERFGLSVDALAASSVETAEIVESQLERQSKQPHSPEDWGALADEATDASLVLLADGQRDRAMRARAWAALFRVHAGRSDEVDANEIEEDTSRYDPRVVAAMAVSRASAAIDAAPDTCVAVAEQTLERARACGDRAIIARALGTLGRAHTHTGTPERAESLFREAIARWSEVEQPQIAQTMCYLATSLRRAGNAQRAMAVATDALAQCLRRSSTAYAEETARFAVLELGRCQLELRLFEEAEVSLTRVIREEFGDASYPNIGALATRCIARFERGDEAGGRADLARCLRVAETPGPIGRVALQAVGFRVLRGDADERARRSWSARRLSTDREGVERALRAWVY